MTLCSATCVAFCRMEPPRTPDVIHLTVVRTAPPGTPLCVTTATRVGCWIRRTDHRYVRVSPVFCRETTLSTFPSGTLAIWVRKVTGRAQA